jgi:hypothetical protein
LGKLELEFKDKESAFQEANTEINQEIGGLKSKLREADKRNRDYQAKGIAEVLLKAEKKSSLLIELQARQTEYDTLTAAFSDVEQQFKTLFGALENEKQEFENGLRAKGLELDKTYLENKEQLKDDYRKEESELKDRLLSEVDQYKDLLKKAEIEKNQLEYSEKDLKRKKYYDHEVTLLKRNLEEIKKRGFEMQASLHVKCNAIESFKKDAEHIKERNKLASEQYIAKNTDEIVALKEKIKVIEDKLSIHQNAFFGFLQTNYPGWFDTIGKVCHEDILFNKDLNPKMAKEGLDQLYGIKLDLSGVPVTSKTLEEYELEKTTLLEEISRLNQAFLEFRDGLAREEQTKLAAIGKKVGVFKGEVDQLTYELEQDVEKEKQLTLDLREWEQKGENQREKDLFDLFKKQELLKAEISRLSQAIAEINNVLSKDLHLLNEKFNTKLVELRKELDQQLEKLKEEKEDWLADYGSRKEKLQKDKSKILKNKGIDDSGLKTLKASIATIKSALAEIDKFSGLINDYKKDKRELFDKVENFHKEKELYEEQLKRTRSEYEIQHEAYIKSRVHLEEHCSQLTVELSKHTDGLNHFETHFKEKALYERLQHIISPAPEMASDAGIISLCTQLLSNESEYHGQFEKFRNNISEFTGRFRPDNHLNFRLSNTGGEGEYEQFAVYLQEFYNENKIQTSIAEVAKNHGMLIDAIATKVKALTDHKGRINRMISKMEADFSRASFESSKLIEYIKLKSEDSENKVLKKLQKIADFREQNPFLYGEVNLFSQGNKGKSEIDKKSVELLNDLQKTISEENLDEIRIQDLFELRFRIKEGKNDTGWIEKIDKVGSTGTDMLVKAVIYITLLNVFIKESTDRSAQNFMVHCIIDEVGQISAPYLKELIKFAEERNICLINGLPNESKLETHYNYTYKFRKDERGNVKVIPLLTMSLEA